MSGPVHYVDTLLDQYPEIIVARRFRGAQSVSMVRTKQQAGVINPGPHDDFGLTMTLSPVAGRLDLAGGRIQGQFRRGAFAVIPPGQQTSIELRSGIDSFALSIPAQMVEAITEPLVSTGLSETFRQAAEQVLYDELVDTLLLCLWQELEGDGLHGRLFTDQAVQTLVLRLLKLTEGTQKRPRGGGLAPWQVRRVCDHMQADLSADPGLAELAAVVDLTTQHFCRAFKASTGLPPHAWLVARRVERARELLDRTDLAVEEIAAHVGYAEPSHLARMFRRAYGLSPTQYRRERPS